MFYRVLIILGFILIQACTTVSESSDKDLENLQWEIDSLLNEVREKKKTQELRNRALEF